MLFYKFPRISKVECTGSVSRFDVAIDFQVRGASNMFNFNAVNESVFKTIMSVNPHRTSDHSCIDGGQVFRDADEKILAIAIPSQNIGFDYFAAADVAAELL